MIQELTPYPAYKDPGVVWLGDVPEHWDVRRLGQIGRLLKGNGGNKDDEVPMGVPCVRYGDLYTTHTYFILSSRSFVSPAKAENYTPIAFGDVLFAASGETIDEIGKSAVNLMQSEACCGGDVILFRSKREVDARYLGYATDCRPAAAQKATMGRGITVMHLYGGQLKYLTIPLPPLPEQAAIVRFLDHANRRIRRYIRAKQKLIKLLEEQKQAIIHRAVTRGLDPDVRFRVSGSKLPGTMPEHWQVRRLKTLVERIDQGVSPQAENYLASGEEWGVLKAGCVNWGRFRQQEHKRLPSDYVVNESLRVKVGDILVSRASGSPHLVGSVGRVREISSRLILSDKIFRLAFRPFVVDGFMVMAMNSRYYRRQVEDAISGAEGLANNLPLAALRCFVFAVPPEEEALRIVEYLLSHSEAAERGVAKAEREIDLIRECQVRLISDVVTGKFDVREAAAELPLQSEEPDFLDDTETQADYDGGDDVIDLDNASQAEP